MKPGATAFTVMPSGPTSRASERVKPMSDGLGGRVDRQAVIAGGGDHGGHVDDAAAVLAHHRAHDVLGEQHRGDRVEAHQALDLLIAHHREHAGSAEAGVVDQPVERPELLAQSR